MLMPAFSPYIIKPIWEQFRALLPESKVDHPLGCHRRRIPDQLLFEKLLQILVFVAPTLADRRWVVLRTTTLRRRREEWIEATVMDNLEEMARQAYERTISLDV
jgi:transposase